MATNTLYYGDNLDVMRRHLTATDAVDLIYLDPPFNSARDYNAFFHEPDGTRSAAQDQAFADTWGWDQVSAAAYKDVVEAGGDVSRALQAFRALLGETDMLAYLAMMAPRLVELRRLLKPSGSIFLHCDPTASHHLKLLMDAVFGPKRFVNEIVWHYYNKLQGNIGHFPENHDTVFWYSKTDKFKFNVQKEKRDKPIRQLKRVWDPVKKSIVNAKGPDGKVMYITSTERRVDDVWTLPMLQPASAEMLGYPTQKPEALLERIIAACTDAGDTVLDPFCGCGTAVAVAHRLGRQWLGIDLTHLAITLLRHRLMNAFGHRERRTDFDVIGEPTDLAGAEQLAATAPYQFQWWVLGKVGARPTPADQKKGADKGIDGNVYFDDGIGRKCETRRIIFSVKAGNLMAAHVRDLRGVIEREKAECGVLLSMDEPTKLMRAEAASAGFYRSQLMGKDYPRLQLLSVAELLTGKTVSRPPPATAPDRTFKNAPSAAISIAAERQHTFAGEAAAAPADDADDEAPVAPIPKPRPAPRRRRT